MTDETPDTDQSGLPGPGVEHALLEPFVGRFAAEVKLWMGPGEPMVSTGEMENAWDLGGRFLRQTYEGDTNDGPFPEFQGRGFWGYNGVDKVWEGFWIDNASTMMQSERGQVDDSGTIWTMTGQMTNPQTGQPMSKRSIITVLDSDRHKMETFFEADGGEFKAMEINYSRRQ